jgi:hypothetical protein
MDGTRTVTSARLLISGHDWVGVLDFATGVSTVRVMPADYRFEGAAVLGSDQPIRTFGLSWHPQFGILVACHERIGRLSPGLDHVGFLGVTPLWYMTHAIAVRGDVLYTCNARIDVLGVHDLASGDEQFVEIGTGTVIPNPQERKPLRDGYQYDRHHPNAVVVSDEQVFLLVHPVGAAGVGSEVRAYDRESLALVSRVVLDERPFGLPYAHDLAIVAGEFIWCDTSRCQVRTTDGRASERLGDENVFLRGLAVDDRDVYVGLVARRGSGFETSQIVRLRSDDLTEVERLDVPFPVEVCTVRIADGLDLGHPGAGPAPLDPLLPLRG